MQDKIRYYIWLTQVPQIGVVSQKLLLNYFENPKSIYEADEKELSMVKGLNNIQVRNIVQARDLDKADRILDECVSLGIDCLTIHDDSYPIRALYDIKAPILLYTKGKLVESKLDKTVAIIGARRCTQDDKNLTLEITREYVAKGYAVVSGMAKGVDSYGHTVCLACDTYTVAVLGNGLDICYPREHDRLMRAIEENGLLLSEYPPGTRPCSYNFPKRNRIIAQWSDEVVVIAPGTKSGSMITAEYACDLGKKVRIFQS